MATTAELVSDQRFVVLPENTWLGFTHDNFGDRILVPFGWDKGGRKDFKYKGSVEIAEDGEMHFRSFRGVWDEAIGGLSQSQYYAGIDGDDQLSRVETVMQTYKRRSFGEVPELVMGVVASLAKDDPQGSRPRSGIITHDSGIGIWQRVNVDPKYPRPQTANPVRQEPSAFVLDFARRFPDYGHGMFRGW